MDCIVTYRINGRDCVCTVNSMDNDPIGLLHKNDVRKQLAEWARKNIKLDASDISLGYVLETMPEFRSRITHAKIRNDREGNQILNRAISKR